MRETLCQLLASHPLQPAVKRNLVLIFLTKRFHRVAVHIVIARWPLLPIAIILTLTFEPGLQRIKGRLPLQALPATDHKLTTCTDARIEHAARLEKVVGQAQRGQLLRHHTAVVDPTSGTQCRELTLCIIQSPPSLRLFALLKIINTIDVDINDVQPVAGRGAVRTSRLGVGRVKRMQGIHADKGTAAPLAPPVGSDRRNRQSPSYPASAAYRAAR